MSDNARAFRMRLVGGPDEGTVLYHLQVREPTADVVDDLLDGGWSPASPKNNAALDTSVLFITADEHVALSALERDQWAGTPIDDAEQL